MLGLVRTVILVSNDPSYSSFIRELRHNLKVIHLSMWDNPPEALKGEAYASVRAGDDYLEMFDYRYPRFNIEELNENSLAELFSEADDRRYNQLRVDLGGEVYFASNEDHPDSSIRFRFEGFQAYNGYVGPKAGSDVEYIAGYLKDIKLAWAHRLSGYIDFSVASLIGFRHNNPGE